MQFPNRQCLYVLCASGLLFSYCSRAQAQVELQKSGDDHISVTINGQPFSDFYIGSAYPKPFLAPLRSATGLIVTRKFPMENVEGESRDHPHHRGLWIGFHDISGVNFWENEFTYNTPNRGKLVLTRLDGLKSGKKSGSIAATFAWRDPKGVEMIEERRTITFSGDDQTRTVDVDVTISAKTNLAFADEKDGFFAIRLADSIAEKNGGMITNSEGAQTEKNTWGKPANWVDYDGTVQGTKVGIVVFDNPQNYNHPERWHVRGYGLFAANPFALQAFDIKTDQKGGKQMAPGDSLRFRYRVIIHPGDVPMKKIADWYSDYSKQ